MLLVVRPSERTKDKMLAPLQRAMREKLHVLLAQLVISTGAGDYHCLASSSYASPGEVGTWRPVDAGNFDPKPVGGVASPRLPRRQMTDRAGTRSTKFVPTPICGAFSLHP